MVIPECNRTNPAWAEVTIPGWIDICTNQGTIVRLSIAMAEDLAEKLLARAEFERMMSKND